VGFSVLLALAALSVAWLILDEPRANVRVIAERLTGNTPERAVADYASALVQRDEPLALARWALPPNASDALIARRATLSHRLLGTARQRVTKTEWWSTCCEPQIVEEGYARYAGFARLSVELDGAPYVFDVIAAGQVDRFHDSGRPRTWLIRDVYPASDGPLFWLWPGR
jgi:hypothetical protein